MYLYTLLLKLDELLRAVGNARTGLVDLEDMSDAELQRLQEEFRRLHERYGAQLKPNLQAVEDELEEREVDSSDTREQND